MSINWSNVNENFLASILAALVLPFVGLVVDEQKARAWIYNQNLRPIIKMIMYIVLRMVSHIMIVVYVVASIFVFVGYQRTLSLLLMVAIFLFYYLKAKQLPPQIKPKESSEFTEGFNKIENVRTAWTVKTGSPTIDEEKGRPKPSLLMKMADPIEATNTFLILNEFRSIKGVVECDIFLSEGAVLNIVVLCDKNADNWHMARYDSRFQNTDGLLIKDQGRGVNWRYNSMSRTRTGIGSWIKARVEYSNSYIRMYRNGELISEILNPPITSEEANYVGIFNECAEVNVDNFVFSSR